MAPKSDLFPIIAAERRHLADELATLTDEQWRQQSLCDAWTCHEVAAHMCMPLELSLPRTLVGMLRHRFDFNAFSIEWAKGQAAQRAPDELLAAIRAKADSTFTPPGLGAEAPLTDTVLHGLDIRHPLGLAPSFVDRSSVDTVLEFMMTPAATKGFLPKDRVPGLRFEATDTGWSHGDGPVVAGPAHALALAISGRRAGLDDLSGEGVDTLRQRLG